MHYFLKYLSKKIYTRLVCLVLAVVLISTIPAAQAEAAVVAQGIDVSKWQGVINWPAVAQSGINFAFVRVGNLKKGIDSTFYYNMHSAQAVGIKTGVYIYSYATNVEEAALEAQFVLNAIKDIPVSYPVVWDVEDDVQKGIPKDTLTLMANTFCAIIESEGYTPMVYASADWYKNRLGTIYYDKWVAQWNTSCSIPDASIWQYTDSGSISGITGNVDLDFAFKDYSSQIIHTGWVPRKGFLYYYINYKMQRGWLDLGLAKYYLDGYGRMVTGWLPLADGVYYMQPDGVMSVGFTPIGKDLYFFDPTGKMLLGLQEPGNGLTYYFAENGAMHTGLLTLPDGVRYFAPDGHMVTGFQLIDGKTYYFDEKGYMKLGAQTIAGLNFFFGMDGVMHTGWLKDGLNTKYYEKDGHMVAAGLATIDGAVYYFDINGNMQTGIVDVGGTPLFFDTDGKLLTLPPVQ